MKSKNYTMKCNDFAMSESLSEFCAMYLREGEEEGEFSRIERIRFQADSNHFFASLATLIDLVLQDEKAFRKKHYFEVFGRIKEDLLYLDKHYNIQPK